MSRLPGAASRQRLQLVQPYDDDVFDTAAVAKQSRRGRRGTSAEESITSDHSASYLSSIRAPAERGGEAGGNVMSLNASVTFPPSRSSTPLPAFSSRGRRAAAGGADTPSASPFASGQAAHGLQSRIVASPSSPQEPLQHRSGAADRLAALYQQYRISPTAASEAGTGSNTASSAQRVPGPSTSPPVPSSDPALASPPSLPRRDRGSENVEVASTLSVDRKPLGASLAPSQRRVASPPPSLGEEVQATLRGPQLVAIPEAIQGSVRSRANSGVSAPRNTTNAAESSLVSAGVPTAVLHQPPIRVGPTVTLPAALAMSGIPGLLTTAIYVWAPLGFFGMPPDEGRERGGTKNEAGGDKEDTESITSASVASSTTPDDTTAQDAEAFLMGLENYCGFFEMGAAVPTGAEFASYCAFLRNGLWRVLFNAVFYCMSVLDRHRRRRGPLSCRETEVCTGGPEDAYEVVFSSSSSSSDVDAGGAFDVERMAPVRLTWRLPGESDADCARRRVQPPLPPDSHLLRGGPPYRPTYPTRPEDDSDASLGRDGQPARQLRFPTEAYGGLLREPVPVTDWYFILRCLAQIGYTRDAFYLQTPSSASPHELLLALLWLTQQYRLLAVAEYVELNRRYAFLLQCRVWQPPPSCGAAATPAEARTRDRLLSQLGHAALWPPVSFEEDSAIQLRLAQLERCLGRSSAPSVAAVFSAPDGPTAPAATLHVRRLMAARRLIGLSLNRLHGALQRQAEQAVSLGLHSSLDAQLCRKEHHTVFEEVMEGLAHVQGMKERLQTAADALAKASSLVAFLLRYDESAVSAEEVLLALEEDDVTWLDNPDMGESEVASHGTASQSSRPMRARGRATATAAERWRRAVHRGTLPQPAPAADDTSEATSSLSTSALALVQSLSNFRATHARGSLMETWKRLLRRSHVAPQSIAPENLRFMLDVEAQAIQEARVRDNMRSRYSLQAALAAELAVLGYERQQSHGSNRASSLARPGVDPRVASTASHPRVGGVVAADASTEVRPLRVALPAMDLITNARTAFAQLQAEEGAYGSVALGTAEMQLAEVGEPTAGATTSARLELERLQLWEQQLDAQLDIDPQTEARIASCKTLLETLFHQHGLRMATPVMPQKME